MERKPYEYRAQYYETDQMGIIHHSNYIRWFESARIDYMDQIGVSYAEMEQSGIISPVVSVSCQYRSMVHFGDTVRIEVTVKKYNGIELLLSYRILDCSSGELRTTGESRHCFLDREGKILTLKRVCPHWHEAFEACLS